MTYTVVSEIRARYPEAEIYLFSPRDYERSDAEKQQLLFNILPWDVDVLLRLMSPSRFSRSLSTYSSNTIDTVRRVLESCSFIVDINGYGLSSQFPFRNAITYLGRIMIARQFQKPIYLLPQSIGPLAFGRLKQAYIQPFLETYLPYPEYICPREADGIKWLSKYTTDNIRQNPDIVLQTSEYNLNSIYRKKPKLTIWDLSDSAVGVVPNIKLFDRMNRAYLHSVYDAAINRLQELQKSVYVFPHSTADDTICREIYDGFEDAERVTLLDNELSAIELERLITQFEFIIASRYHSIIHSYKNHVPVVGLGWAVKYKELMAEFDQTEFFFDGRQHIERSDVLSAIEAMNETRDQQSLGISETLTEIQSDSIFNTVL